MQQKVRKNNIIEILKINEGLSHIHDIDSLMDRVLSEARKITRSDAGSIYLIQGEELSFEYVQNDTLMKDTKSSNKYLYSKQRIPINNDSISGYVALNKKPLIIEDVYQIPSHVPYSFNRSFDDSSSYHTQSTLTVPLITSRDKVIGVIQIINAKDKNQQIIPYTKYDEHLVSLFANQAANAIERARITREIILRMIKIAELRDPMETGAHVNRVASYAHEIYQRWAHKNHIPDKKVKSIKDILRIAAMLHDVGKVAISDSILKKRARLNDKEFNHMKLHTVFGARLFTNSNSDWDDMAAEIALNHHERWDGSGYPGPMENIHNTEISMDKGKKGEEIPLVARIVALADVYDALISDRSYKNSWPEDQVLEYIVEQKDKHFDPKLVEAFLDIKEVIGAIREKYSSL